MFGIILVVCIVGIIVCVSKLYRNYEKVLTKDYTNCIIKYKEIK